MITSYYISNFYLFSCWEFVICMDLWHTNQELFIQHVLARIFPCFFYCLNPCWLYRKLLSQRLEKEVVYGQNYSGKIPKGYLFWIIRHLKLEDYKFKEDTTHQAYFPSATVFNKVRNLLGFNLETEAIPLPNGKLFDVTKECNQVVVSALVRTTIKYDDGGHFSHYKKF